MVSKDLLSLAPRLWQVRDALQQEFPSYDVVEFFGVGSIVSQLRLFAAASLVVAPHGAGLSNIMVSPRHTPVLEIAPPACTACYIHLALKVKNALFLFLVLVCSVVQPAGDASVGPLVFEKTGMLFSVVSILHGWDSVVHETDDSRMSQTAVLYPTK